MIILQIVIRSFIAFLKSLAAFLDFVCAFFHCLSSSDYYPEDKSTNPVQMRLIVFLHYKFFYIYRSFGTLTVDFVKKLLENAKKITHFLDENSDSVPALDNNSDSTSHAGGRGAAVVYYKNGFVFVCCLIEQAVLYFPFFLLIFLLVLSFHLFYCLCFVLWFVTLYIVKFADYVYQTRFILLSNCSTCKHEIRHFSLRCPTCSEVHYSLTPDFRGIFTHICKCGTPLKNELFSRNTNYEHLCPYCNRPAERRFKRAYAVQIAGPRSSGKTILLCHLIKSFKDYFPCNEKLKISFQDSSVSEWIDGSIKFPRPTMLLNSQVTTLRHLGAMFHPSFQFDFYDASGELFERGKAEVVQRQFGYCSFLIVTIDPALKPSVTEMTITNMIGMYKEITGFPICAKSDIPVAVVVTGSRSNTFLNQTNIKYDLLHSGFRNSIFLLESEFSCVEYYLIYFTDGRNEKTESLIKLRDRLLQMTRK